MMATKASSEIYKMRIQELENMSKQTCIEKLVISPDNFVKKIFDLVIYFIMVFDILYSTYKYLKCLC